MEGILFRPQGEPMVYPYTMAARISQFPWRHFWNESWFVRYGAGVSVFILLPIYLKINKFVNSPENEAMWREKKKQEAHDHHKHMEKLWEVRT